MFKNFFYFSCIFLSIFSYFSCASVQSAWFTDASKMKKEVQSAKKDAFILFTGSDWDDESQKLLAKRIDRELFLRYGKQFLFYHVDIVRNEDAMNAKQLKTNYLLFSKYGVGDLPHIVARCFEGDVYYSSHLDTNAGIDDVMNNVITQRKKVQKLKDEIRFSSSVEKIRAIDTFFSSIYNADHAMYDDLRMQAIEADPENESGLLGRFQMMVASLKDEKLVVQKKHLTAADEYIILLKAESGRATPSLKPEERQNAWYQIAYLYALSKKVENEKIVYCLKNAISAAPESDAVPRLKEIINEIINHVKVTR